MSVQVLVRILATLPETPGAWPPLDLNSTSEGLVVVQGKAEEPDAGVPHNVQGEAGPSPSDADGPAELRTEDASEGKSTPEPAGWLVEDQQRMTSRHTTIARGVCMNLSGPGPMGLVPRTANSDVLDMIGHSDLI